MEEDNMINTFPDKRVATIKDYDFDFTSFIGNETITDATVTITPTGLSESTTKAINAGVVKVFLKDGVVGETYTITVLITTSGGRREQMSPTLRVVA
jgi:hypothetical protein